MDTLASPRLFSQKLRNAKIGSAKAKAKAMSKKQTIEQAKTQRYTAEFIPAYLLWNEFCDRFAARWLLEEGCPEDQLFDEEADCRSRFAMIICGFHGVTLPSLLSWSRRVVKSAYCDKTRKIKSTQMEIEQVPECELLFNRADDYDCDDSFDDLEFMQNDTDECKSKIFDEILRLMDSLPDRRRCVLQKKYIEKKSCSEIMADLSMPHSTVYYELRERVSLS